MVATSAPGKPANPEGIHPSVTMTLSGCVASPVSQSHQNNPFVSTSHYDGSHCQPFSILRTLTSESRARHSNKSKSENAFLALLPFFEVNPI